MPHGHTRLCGATDAAAATDLAAPCACHLPPQANDQAAAALISAKLIAARDALPTTLAQDRAALRRLQQARLHASLTDCMLMNAELFLPYLPPREPNVHV